MSMLLWAFIIGGPAFFCGMMWRENEPRRARGHEMRQCEDTMQPLIAKMHAGGELTEVERSAFDRANARWKELL